MLALIYQKLHDQPDAFRMSGIVVGIVLLVVHLLAWLRAKDSLVMARKFPRDKRMGVILLAIATVWSWGLLKGLNLGPIEIPQMMLGEFSGVRRPMLMLLPVFYFLVVFFADDFLAVRALGCVQFLVASFLLDLHWQHFEHFSMLLMPIYGYGLIFSGMIMVGTPYRIRDWLTTFDRKPAAWAGALMGGALFGGAMLASALLWW